MLSGTRSWSSRHFRFVSSWWNFIFFSFAHSLHPAHSLTIIIVVSLFLFIFFPLLIAVVKCCYAAERQMFDGWMLLGEQWAPIVEREWKNHFFCNSFIRSDSDSDSDGSNQKFVTKNRSWVGYQVFLLLLTVFLQFCFFSHSLSLALLPVLLPLHWNLTHGSQQIPVWPLIQRLRLVANFTVLFFFRIPIK